MQDLTVLLLIHIPKQPTMQCVLIQSVSHFGVTQNSFLCKKAKFKTFAVLETLLKTQSWTKIFSDTGIQPYKSHTTLVALFAFLTFDPTAEQRHILIIGMLLSRVFPLMCADTNPHQSISHHFVFTPVSCYHLGD